LRRGALGVRAGAGVAVAALVLTAGTAGARVVAADVGKVVADARARAGLHVRPAVDRRSLVLQALRSARGEPGRDRRVLTAGRTLAAGRVLTAGSALAAGRGAGPPGVGAGGPAIPPGRLALRTADPASSP